MHWQLLRLHYISCNSTTNCFIPPCARGYVPRGLYIDYLFTFLEVENYLHFWTQNANWIFILM